jgi:hypothetical protein
MRATRSKGCVSLSSIKHPESSGKANSCAMNLLPFDISFGSLQRINLRLRLTLGCSFRVRGEVALARFPLYGWIRIAGTILPQGQFQDSLAALALFYYGMTRASIVPTASFSHEGAFSSFFYSGADHDKYLQF